MLNDSVVSSFLKGDTYKEISKSHNITIDKVRWILKKRGVYTPRNPRLCIELPIEDIIEKYKNDISIQDIASEYKVSTQPIIKILKEHDIRKPVWLKHIPYKTMEKMLDFNYFSNIVNIHISKSNIANHFNCGIDLINSLYKYHNIPSISSGLTKSLMIQSTNQKLQMTLENFTRLYTEDKKTLDEIASDFAVSVGFLRKHLKEWEVDFIRDGFNTSDKFNLIKNDSSLLATELETLTVPMIAKKYECGTDSIYNFIKKHNLVKPDIYRSISEEEICTHITNKGINVLCNNRSIIHPFELDLYIPDKYIAIEFCGLYWHSEMYKHKHYHSDKLKKCNDKDIRLITIFEDEWIEHKDIVLSKIDNILNVSQSDKVFARKCSVMYNVPVSVQKTFYGDNHIQGYGKGSIVYSLSYNNEIVAMMSFIKKSNNTYELNRYATKYNVIGGFTKLLTKFVEQIDFSELISFADLRWSEGNLYKNTGWEIDSIIRPDYSYIVNGKRKHKFNYRHTSGLQKLERYDSTLSEHNNMLKHKLFRIYDCGKIRFVYKKKGA